MMGTPGRRIAAFALFAMTAGLVSARSLADNWHAWRFTREISSTHPGALNYIPLGPEVLSRANPDISDVRILDETGTETPYVVRTTIGVTKTDS